MKIADTVLIPLAALTPSKLNPRTTFDEAYIAELADNIRKHGVLENLLVRPDWCKGTTTPATLAAAKPKGEWDGGFEIVSGECRWRAAKLAGLTELPVRIKELTDPELEELNLAEQLARKDLTPLEEARSFQRLLTYKDDAGKPRHTRESLANTLGFTTANPINNRLKLLDLPESARKALGTGVLSLTIAQYIARVPDAEQRADAAKQIIKGHDGEPMTKREAWEFINQNFMRELKGAPFDQEDATLVKHLPQFSPHVPCSTCPFRTGNNKAAFGDVKRGDICTRPGCYAAKVQATFDRAAAQARERGVKVVSPADSLQVFPAHERVGQMRYDSPYVILDTKPEPHLLKPVVKSVPTWRELVETMKGKELKVETFLAADQSGRAVEIAQRDLIVAGSEKAGEPIFRGKNERQPTRNDGESKRIKEEREAAKLNAAVAVAVVEELRIALVKKFDGMKGGIWQALGLIAFDQLGGEGASFLGRWQKLKCDGTGGWVEVVAAWMEKLPAAEQCAMVPLLMLAEKLRWRGIEAPGLAMLCDWAQVDIKAVEKKATAAYKAAGKSSGPKAAKKPKPAAGPKKPAGKAKGAAARAVAAVKSSAKKPAAAAKK